MYWKNKLKNDSKYNRIIGKDRNVYHIDLLGALSAADGYYYWVPVHRRRQCGTLYDMGGKRPPHRVAE